jgi:hypothetical protein
MHVILVWVLNFVSGLLAGIALVASLFSLVFVLLANGYLDWSAHRVEEPPFQLHERRTPPTVGDFSFYYLQIELCAGYERACGDLFMAEYDIGDGCIQHG